MCYTYADEGRLAEAENFFRDYTENFIHATAGFDNASKFLMLFPFSFLLLDISKVE